MGHRYRIVYAVLVVVIAAAATFSLSGGLQLIAQVFAGPMGVDENGVQTAGVLVGVALGCSAVLVAVLWVATEMRAHGRARRLRRCYLVRGGLFNPAYGMMDLADSSSVHTALELVDVMADEIANMPAVVHEVRPPAGFDPLFRVDTSRLRAHNDSRTGLELDDWRGIVRNYLTGEQRSFASRDDLASALLEWHAAELCCNMV